MRDEQMPTVKREGSKVYIEGVRRLSWDTGEMCEFASALVAALEVLGERVAYPFVMGTSGAAFRFTLDPGAWNFGNYGIRNIAADPYAAMRRALDATGYTYSIHEQGSRNEDLARIVASLERGAPVLAYPVVGPSDCCILTGYDEGGDVLLGWSTYQDIPDDHDIPHDSTGYFRKPGWHDNLVGYVILGDKHSPPPRRAVYGEALAWAVALLRTPMRPEHVTGLEGLRMWAAEMQDPQYFPEDDEDTLGWRYVSAAVNMTMLRDHCTADPFLTQMAMDEPEWATELDLAIACYAEVSRLRDEMDLVMGDNFSEAAMKAIGDAQARRTYAELILQIRLREAEAAAHLERIVTR
jgi:hypothetical protein